MTRVSFLMPLLVATCAPCLFATSANAVVYDITQITFNEIDDFSPQISGDNVGWTQQETIFDPSSVFLFDGVTTTLLNSNGLSSGSLQLSGDHALWKSFDSNWDVYLYDGTTTTQLTNTPLNEISLTLSGNHAAWVDDVNFARQLYYYDGVTTTQITTSGTHNTEPHISGNQIVWEYRDQSFADIALFDGATTTFLTNTATSEGSPQISGQNIVWTGKDGNDSAIFFYDGVSTIQLTNNSSNQYAVKNSGNNVVWLGHDGNDDEVFFYDGTTITQLTDNDFDDKSPQISGDKVVWTGKPSGGDDEIFFFDGVSTTQLTDNSSHETGVMISGDKIVWQAHDGNDYEIILAAPVDTPSNASFSTGSDENVHNIDLGDVVWDQPAAPVAFQIANLFSPNDIASLELTEVAGTGDTGILSTDLSLFADLIAGQTREFNTVITTDIPGAFSATYELNFTDALGTDQTLTLNLSGEVVLPDDPNIPDLIYNAATGEVILDPDDSSIIGYTLQNESDAFLSENFSAVLGGVSTAIPSELSEAALSPGAGSIGFVLPAGLNITDLFQLLTVNQVSTGLGAPLVPFDLIVIGETPAVPEPSTYGMAAVALLGLALCGWRRRHA